MLHELDTVVLTHDIREHGLRQNDVGTIVHCYKNSKVFDVEFVTGDGETIAVLILTGADIRPVRQREILHVRSGRSEQGLDQLWVRQSCVDDLADRP